MFGLPKKGIDIEYKDLTVMKIQYIQDGEIKGNLTFYESFYYCEHWLEISIYKEKKDQISEIAKNENFDA